MSLAGNTVINCYSLAILAALYIHTRKKPGPSTFQEKMFFGIIYVTAMMLISDTMGRFDGRPGTYYVLLNHAGNFIVFLLSPIAPALWLIYVQTQTDHSEKSGKRLRAFCYFLLAIHTALIIATQFTGWLYAIDDMNVYRRGPLYMLSSSVMLVFMVIAVVIIWRNRRVMEKKQFRSLLFFAVPPFITAILHDSYYGISIVLNGLVLSILIVFLNIQNRSLVTDYLTDVYNRKGFDMYLQEKIRAGRTGKAFSAVLMDFDRFKSINDTFGHDMGDMALQKSAELIKSCIRSTDFISRFGGDEFVLVLDTANINELEEIVGRINHTFNSFNNEGSQPYTISFSAGYAVYDIKTRPDAMTFMKALDRMMYQMKQKTNQ